MCVLQQASLHFRPGINSGGGCEVSSDSVISLPAVPPTTATAGWPHGCRKYVHERTKTHTNMHCAHKKQVQIIALQFLSPSMSDTCAESYDCIHSRPDRSQVQTPPFRKKLSQRRWLNIKRVKHSCAPYSTTRSLRKQVFYTQSDIYFTNNMEYSIW